MAPEHDLLGLAGKIHESAFAPSPWSGFLNLLAPAAGGNRGNGNQARDSRGVS